MLFFDAYTALIGLKQFDNAKYMIKQAYVTGFEVPRIYQAYWQEMSEKEEK